MVISTCQTLIKLYSFSFILYTRSIHIKFLLLGYFYHLHFKLGPNYSYLGLFPLSVLVIICQTCTDHAVSFSVASALPSSFKLYIICITIMTSFQHTFLLCCLVASYTVKTKGCYPYFFGMVFLFTPYIPFFGMSCILPVCNPHPKRYEMHTLNMFQNKRNTFKY